MWIDPVEIVNVRDVVLSKLSVRAEYDAKYDLTDYVVQYDGGGFWLVIDDLKGYFDFSDSAGFLKLLLKSKEQETLYDQVWKQIVSFIDGSGMIKDSVKFRLNSDDLPVGCEFKINTVTVVVNNDRIKLSEGIDTTQNKLISRECWLCHFCFFLGKNFSHQWYPCNSCHDMSVKAMSMQNLAVIYIRGNAYRVNFAFMSRNDAYNSIRNANIIDEKGVL